MTRIVFGLFLDFLQCGYLGSLIGFGCSFAGLSSELPKLFPVTVSSSLFCFFVAFVAFSLHSYYYFTCNPGEVRFGFGVSARNIAVN